MFFQVWPNTPNHHACAYKRRSDDRVPMGPVRIDAPKTASNWVAIATHGEPKDPKKVSKENRKRKQPNSDHSNLGCSSFLVTVRTLLIDPSSPLIELCQLCHSCHSCRSCQSCQLRQLCHSCHSCQFCHSCQLCHSCALAARWAPEMQFKMAHMGCQCWPPALHLGAHFEVRGQLFDPGAPRWCLRHPLHT